MESAMPKPLPSAVSGFRAGAMAKDTVKYPHLPKSVAVKAVHTTYPSLASSGKAPATKIPAGMTRPILTKMGGHPEDTASRLPATGSGIGN